MTQYSTPELLAVLAVQQQTVRDVRPWGYMDELSSPEHNLTIKRLIVEPGQRTSLQVHRIKDEVMLILGGTGKVETWEGNLMQEFTCFAGQVIHVKPGMQHRVTGPLHYVEISTYDDGEDTIRLEDDFGRS